LSESCGQPIDPEANIFVIATAPQVGWIRCRERSI
jgi:hypothetical protein